MKNDLIAAMTVDLSSVPNPSLPRTEVTSLSGTSAAEASRVPPSKRSHPPRRQHPQPSKERQKRGNHRAGNGGTRSMIGQHDCGGGSIR